jgi:hypothetical protein
MVNIVTHNGVYTSPNVDIHLQIVNISIHKYLHLDHVHWWYAHGLAESNMPLHMVWQKAFSLFDQIKFLSIYPSYSFFFFFFFFFLLQAPRP